MSVDISLWFADQIDETLAESRTQDLTQFDSCNKAIMSRRPTQKIFNVMLSISKVLYFDPRSSAKIHSHRFGECDLIVRNTYGNDCGKAMGYMPAFMTDHCDGTGNFLMSAPLFLELAIAQIHGLDLQQENSPKPQASGPSR